MGFTFHAGRVPKKNLHAGDKRIQHAIENSYEQVHVSVDVIPKISPPTSTFKHPHGVVVAEVHMAPGPQRIVPGIVAHAEEGLHTMGAGPPKK